MTCLVRLRTLGVLALVVVALAAARAAPAQMHDVLAVSPVDLAALAAPPIDAFGLETHDTSVPGPCYRVWQCNGVDLLAPRGTPIRAPFSGTVEFGTNRVGGRSFLLRSSTGLTEAYGAHMSAFASIQARTVSTGDVLGYVGTSGNAIGGPPHLHFALAAAHAGKWVAVDPFPALMTLRRADPGSPSPWGIPPDAQELVKVAAVHSPGGALRPGDESIDVTWTGPDDPLVTVELSLAARHQDGGTESDVLRAHLPPSGQQRLRIPQGLAPGRYAVRLATLHDGTKLGSTLSTQRVLIASS